MVATKVTPTYRLDIIDKRGTRSTIWQGPATKRKLHEAMVKYCESFKPGGTNEHVTKQLGYQPWPQRAQIVEQKTGRVKAEWIGSYETGWENYSNE